jgi:transposase-like protein
MKEHLSASMVSSLAESLDAEVEAWRNRPLEGEYPYIFVDALYEKVRHDGKVVSMAVLIVIGVNDKGCRSVLAVDVSHSENEADYGDLFKRLMDCGLSGVQLVISDDHKGMRKAIDRHFTGVSWQRCQVHFMRNFLAKLRKKDKTWALAALKDVFNAPDKEQAALRLKRLVEKLSETDQRLADWLEENIQETMAAFNFPEQHRRRIKSTNCLERLNEEIRRRTRVIRIFPQKQSCLRLISALCIEKDEEWTTGKKYLNMTLLEKNYDVIKAVKFAG